MDENKEIDLERMQKLLNGFSNQEVQNNYNKEIHTDVKNNNEESDSINTIFKDFKDLKIENPKDDINIDYADLKHVLNMKGRVSGYSNITDSKNLYDDIVQNIPKEDFKNAKAVICTYIVNPDVSMFAIGDVMEKLHDLLVGNAEVLFGTSTTDDLSIYEIGYKILITGIEDYDFEKIESNQDFDLRFHKQLYNENHLLKNKFSDMEIEIRTLKAQKDRLEKSLLALK